MCNSEVIFACMPGELKKERERRLSFQKEKLPVTKNGIQALPISRNKADSPGHSTVEGKERREQYGEDTQYKGYVLARNGDDKKNKMKDTSKH